MTTSAPEYVGDGHLGGYIRGGDDATLYPDLWRWLVDTHGVHTVIDVGCGEGHSTEAFRGLGCHVLPIDGMPQPDVALFVQHDYTTFPFVPAARYDLAWVCEFVEHVHEVYEQNWLATVRAAELVLMTHAEPGQPGWHHVNCRPATYWVARMRESGYDLDALLTANARHMAASNPSPWNHFARSGLAFRRAVR